MIERGGGKIVSVASALGTAGAPAPYHCIPPGSPQPVPPYDLVAIFWHPYASSIAWRGASNFYTR